MNKVTYKLSNLFTLKKYNDNNLNCQSYEYPTIYGIRCAIIGAIIKVDGVEKAKELFYKVKNSNIFIQYPENFKINGINLKRHSNSFYDKMCSKDSEINKSLVTMGFRQYIAMDKIVFYIDDLIPDIQTYLKNIDWLGTAESMVYLHTIEQTDTIENVLVEWNKEDDTCIYEQQDFSTKTEFDNIYFYSDKYHKRNHKTFMCSIKTLQL